MKEPGTIAPTLTRALLAGDRMAVAERYRIAHNSLSISPTMRAVLDDALIHAKPVTQMEQKFGWPARSAKAIVGVLLNILAEENTCTDLSPETEPKPKPERQLEYLCATGFDREIARHMALWGLNLGEARVLEIMRRAPEMTLSRTALHARIYPHNDDPPELKIIDVRISGLRRKLKGSGVLIKRCTASVGGWFGQTR